MKEITNLDEAQLKFEMRQMYKIAGLDGSLQALYEILIAGRILSEVITEETQNDKSKKRW